MKQCDGQIKFKECMTFKEKMKSKGWHNCHDKEPDEPGTYQVYLRNGKIRKAYYVKSHIWRENHSGYEFCWWRKMP